jgi:hypothetical protein
MGAFGSVYLFQVYYTTRGLDGFGEQEFLVKCLTFFKPLLTEKLSGLMEEADLESSHRPVVDVGKLSYQRRFAASLIPGTENVYRMIIG